MIPLMKKFTLFLTTVSLFALCASAFASSEVDVKDTKDPHTAKVIIRFEAAKKIIETLGKKINPIVEKTDGFTRTTYIGKNLTCNTALPDSFDESMTAYTCVFEVNSLGKTSN